MKKILIFTDYANDDFNAELKLGTPKAHLITRNSLTGDDRLYLSGIADDKKEEVAMRRIIQKTDTAFSEKSDLIIIATDVYEKKNELEEINRKARETYEEYYDVLDVATRYTRLEPSQKPLRFINGIGSEKIGELLLKSFPKAKLFSSKNDTEFNEACLSKEDIPMIIVITDEFSTADYEYYIRSGATGNFVPQYIDLASKPKEQISPIVHTDSVGNIQPLKQEVDVGTKKSSVPYWWNWFWDKTKIGKFLSGNQEETTEAQQELSVKKTSTKSTEEEIRNAQNRIKQASAEFKNEAKEKGLDFSAPKTVDQKEVQVVQ